MQHINIFFEHLKNLITHSQFEFLLILIGVIAALWRRTRLDVSLAIMVIVAHIGLAIFTAVPLLYYVVPLGVIYSLLIAGLFERGLSRVGTARHWVGAACFLSIGLGYTLSQPMFVLRAGAPRELPIPAAAAWVRANAQPDDLIVAEHFYFFYLTDYRFVSALTPEYMQPQFRPPFEEIAQTLDVRALQGGRDDITLEQYTYRSAVWDEIAPEIVILDRNYTSCCVPPILDEPYLESRGYQVVATFDGDLHPVLVYRKPNP